MTDRTARMLAVIGWVLAVALVAWTYALQPPINGHPGLAHETSIETDYEANLVVLVTMAALLVWARPRNPVGWLLGLSGLMGILCNWGQTYGAHALVVPGSHLPLGSAVLSMSAPLWLLSLGIPATLLLARYPSGRIEGVWARRLDRVVVVALVIQWAAYTASAESVTDVVTTARPPLELAIGPAVLVASSLVLLVAMLLTAGMTIRRLIRSTWPERPQLALLLSVAPISVLSVVFSPYEWIGSVFFSLMPLSVVVGVLRYRLLGIEVVVRRTLLYAGLTGLVLAVFVLVTSGVNAVFRDGPGSQLVAAGIVAIGVVPVRDRLQRLVDRLVYGDRRDPWRALDRLGRGAVHGDGIQDVVEAVTQSLRLPAAELLTPAGPAAAVGTLTEPVTVVPLEVAGEQVGVLRVAPRSGERSLGAEDERLLLALAPMLAVALRSRQLADALRVEQERTVAATQTERARLRRDLHDGLGPSLTGIGLGLEAIDNQALPERSASVVKRLRAEVASCLEEVRRIIDDLRPGLLEGRDLLRLLTARAEQLTATTPVRVTVVAPPELPPLPLAVEAATLRIVEEALTNVLRHAGATACEVQLSLDDALVVRVIDDGKGFAGPRQGGVGIGSMRARAASLGGDLRTEATHPGTVVTAELPLLVPA